MPSASFLFLLFLYFKNLLLEIFSELNENLRRFFMRRKTPEDQREAWAGTAPCHGPPFGRMWDPPLLLVGPLGPLRRL